MDGKLRLLERVGMRLQLARYAESPDASCCMVRRYIAAHRPRNRPTREHRNSEQMVQSEAFGRLHVEQISPACLCFAYALIYLKASLCLNEAERGSAAGGKRNQHSIKVGHPERTKGRVIIGRRNACCHATNRLC